MAVPQGHEQIGRDIEKELSDTPYAIHSTTLLSGGTVNFIFHAILKQPLPDGTTEVVVKHGEDFVALSPGFKLNKSRCQIEVQCLQSLADFPPHISSNFTISTPKILSFNPETSTQVQQYLPTPLDLKNYALKHYAAPTPESARSQCFELGHGLGEWLRSFHSWANDAEQSKLRAIVSQNEEMQALKHMINYQWLVKAIDKYPSILSDCSEVFGSVNEMATTELADKDQLAVIHGDFWTGKYISPSNRYPSCCAKSQSSILLQNKTIENGGSEKMPVFVVDWELSHLGMLPLDVGQMVAELYELKLFKNSDAGLWIIEGLASGYGQADESFAFRTAIHVGVHLVVFGGSVAGWGTTEEVEKVVAVGRDLILRAWHRDRAWFNDHALGCFFTTQ